MPDASRNIVILPPPHVIAEAESRSALIDELTSGQNEIRLDHTKQRWPHITLYQFGLPEKNIDWMTTCIHQVIRELSTYAKKFKLRLRGYHIYGGTGIFWMIESPPPALQHLHKDIVHNLNATRSGVVLEQHRPLFASDSGITDRQREYLGRYGYPTALDEYLPHITIGATADAVNVIKQLPDDPIEFTVEELHITEIGPSGTCPESLERIPLR